MNDQDGDCQERRGVGIPPHTYTRLHDSLYPLAAPIALCGRFEA